MEDSAGSWGICFVAAETQQCSASTSRQPQNFFSCHGKDVKGCEAEQEGGNRAGQGGAEQGGAGQLRLLGTVHDKDEYA